MVIGREEGMVDFETLKRREKQKNRGKKLKTHKKHKKNDYII